MLVSKEEEIDKLKGRNPTPQNGVKTSKSIIDFDNTNEVQSSPIVKKMHEIEEQKVKETLNQDYIKNVFIKYLEY